jgi:hypothetical protein
MTTLYLLNFALLFTHQVDAAYWHEWELFGLSGDGIQAFLVVNFVLLVVALYGFKQVVQDTRAGPWFSLVLAAAGAFTFALHGYFLLTGHPEFRLPASLAVLALTLAVSLAQAWLAVAALRRAGRSRTESRGGRP